MTLATCHKHQPDVSDTSARHHRHGRHQMAFYISHLHFNGGAPPSVEIINFIGLDVPVAETIQHNHPHSNSPVQDANAAHRPAANY